MFMAIRTFSLVFINLLIVALKTYLILTIAGVKVLFLLLKANLANIANVLTFSNDLDILFFRDKWLWFVSTKLISIQAGIIFNIFGCILLLLFCGIVVAISIVVW